MEYIRHKLVKFRDERGWGKHHTPANLAKSIMIEAAELNRLYQWGDEWHQPDMQEIRDEIADIAIYLTYLCIEYGIDLEQAIIDKIEKNAVKYPPPRGQEG